MQIMDMYRLVLRLEAKIIRGPVDMPSLDPAPRQNRREPVAVVVPTILDPHQTAYFHYRSSPELAADDHQRFVQ